MKFVLCVRAGSRGLWSEDGEGQYAFGEGGLVPEALRPSVGCWQRQRRERGFEVDAHVGIFELGMLPVGSTRDPGR